MEYDPKQEEILIKLVDSVLGDRLGIVSENQVDIIDSHLDSLMEDHKGQADQITADEIEGAYEMAQYILPNG